MLKPRLVVKRVYATGLLAKWNDRVPQLEVKPHDRIVAVNDETTAEGMAKEIHQSRIFLQMMRPDHLSKDCPFEKRTRCS